jgi:holo-[acyl-carrier protein] synthase
MRELTIGVDVVDVREVEASLAVFGERYVSRLYTPAEAAYAREAPAQTARRLGARFAAKEATIKALRASEAGIDPRAIEVVRGADGACELVLAGSALAAAERVGVRSLALSLTHQGDIAAAVVVGERTRDGIRHASRRPPTARRPSSRAARDK